MNEHILDTKIRKLQREHTQLEGLIMGQLASLEKILRDADNTYELLERGHAFVDAKEEQAKRVLAVDPNQRAACEKTLRMVAQRRARYNLGARKTKMDIRKAIEQLKGLLRKHLNNKQFMEETLEARAKIAQEQQQQNSGGMTLLGNLGAALFAWRASNAFDNLSKIAKGK